MSRWSVSEGEGEGEEEGAEEGEVGDGEGAAEQEADQFEQAAESFESAGKEEEEATGSACNERRRVRLPLHHLQQVLCLQHQTTNAHGKTS